MSSEQVAAAIDRIKNDSKFAAAVLREPEATLTAEFDLEPNEWKAIHFGLAQDVSRAVDFSQVEWSSISDIRGAFHKVMTPTVIPAKQMQPTVIPGERMQPTVIPGERMQPTVIPGERVTPKVIPGKKMTPTVIPMDVDVEGEDGS